MTIVKQSIYKNKKIAVGIDVHKKTYNVTVFCEMAQVKNWTMKSCPETLIKQIKHNFSGAKIFTAYESGFSGFTLHRMLEKEGFTSLVVNPASIEVRSNDMVKTDKRDSGKIARQLDAGYLNSIYIPTLEEEEYRSLSRGREQAVERRKTIGNQLKMKLHYLGIKSVEDKKISGKFLKWLESQPFSGGHATLIEEYILAWKEEAQRIRRFDTELKEQALTDKNEAIYRSAPGVGAVSSRVLSNELDDMSRFNNEREIFSYSGLTPSEFSSGDRVRKGRITRQGSARIRGIMVEVAWRAIKLDIGLNTFYKKLSARKGGKKAIVATARKMLGQLRKCLKDKKTWVDQGAIVIPN